MDLNYQQLATAILTQLGGLQVGYKALPGAPIPAGAYGHGNGGLFSRAGLERPIVNAMTLPALGLASVIPTGRGSVYDNPQYGIMTGVTASVGSNPVSVCDDPPTAGLMKLCTQMLPFGRFSRQSNVYDADRFGRRRDRADMVDLQLLGNPFQGEGAASNPLIPTIPGGNASNALNTEIAKAMFEVATAFARDFARVTFTGNTTNNTAGGGYREFFGLDKLINTGRVDAETGFACPAADSVIVNSGGLAVATNGGTVVNTFSAIMRLLKRNAARMGLDPATWVIGMRSDLFYELTRIWPCSYQTNGCNVASGQVIAIGGAEQVQMRDEMRNGSFLWIDGQKVQVVEDEAIIETAVGTGVYESDVYFVPLTIMGGTKATFWEYFDYDAAGSARDGNVFAAGNPFVTSDGGRFLWAKKPAQNWCVQLLGKIEPRLVMLTPQIAARYNDLRYSPVIHERSSFPGDPYFVNGGAVYGTTKTFYSPS